MKLSDDEGLKGSRNGFFVNLPNKGNVIHSIELCKPYVWFVLNDCVCTKIVRIRSLSKSS